MFEATRVSRKIITEMCSLNVIQLHVLYFSLSSVMTSDQERSRRAVAATFRRAPKMLSRMTALPLLGGTSREENSREDSREDEKAETAENLSPLTKRKRPTEANQPQKRSQAHQRRQPLPESSIRSCQNVGNSCYFNATVQSVAPIKGLCTECAREWDTWSVGDRVTTTADDRWFEVTTIAWR